MRLLHPCLLAPVLVTALFACGGSSGEGGGGSTATTSSTTTTTTTTTSSSSTTTTTSAPVDKAKDCASTFGQSLTDGFGRLDGTVLAVVGTADAQCAQANATHLVVQMTVNGEAYRMVANLDVLTLVKEHNLPAPAWSEGWHPGVTLDYVADMGAKSADFEQHTTAEVEATVTDAITLGQKISVYATSGGTQPDSAHLIHRNTGTNDGVIFLDPDGAHPKAMMFRFANQTNF